MGLPITSNNSLADLFLAFLVSFIQRFCSRGWESPHVVSMLEIVHDSHSCSNRDQECPLRAMDKIGPQALPYCRQ